MSATFTPTNMLLEPGTYLVELAFARPCDPEILRRALEAMGWKNVVFDEAPSPVTGATASELDAYAQKGRNITPSRKRFVAARASSTNKDWVYGFDVAVGVCEGMSLPGPGQDGVRNSLASATAKTGFAIGQKLQHDWTKGQALLSSVRIAIDRKSPAAPGLIAQYEALTGEKIAYTPPPVSTAPVQAVARVVPVAAPPASSASATSSATLDALAQKGKGIAATRKRFTNVRSGADKDWRWGYEASPAWTYGFDVGIGTCEGMSLPGSGQDNVRESLSSASAKNGFNAGQRLQHEWTKGIALCASARAAVARQSPAAPGLIAQCEALTGEKIAYTPPPISTAPVRAVARVQAPSSPLDSVIDKSITASPSTVISTARGCGVAPASTLNALGIRRYNDPAAGKTYVDCLAAEQLAKEKAFYDKIVAKQAGGDDGCGPDVKDVYNSGSQYTGTALKNAWAACRSAAKVTLSPIAYETPATVPQPYVQPGSTALPDGPDVTEPSGGGGGGGGGGTDSSEEAAPYEDAPPPAPEAWGQLPAQTDQAPATPSPEDVASPQAPSVPEDPLAVLVSTLKNLSPGEPPSEPLPNETDMIRTLRLQNLWRRWNEWGSPFSTSPAGGIDDLALSKARISGLDDHEGDRNRIRFLGRLEHPLKLVNPPGMWWVLVKHLVLHYDDDIRIQVEPHRLEPGRFYEFRFLSRDKSAPTRDVVKKRLADMGFAPMKLSLLKRNIRLPNRPSSLSMWYGMGQWLHPSTVVTVEDPFYFEQVQEATP